MFFHGLFTLTLALTTSFVAARDPSADELAAVEQAFVDARIVPDIIPEMDLEAFFLLAFLFPNGTESVAVKDPAMEITVDTAARAPAMATQGIPHVKDQRLVAIAVDLDAPEPQFRMMLAQDLVVGDDTFLPHLRSGAHLLNNNVTGTPPANPFVPPAPEVNSGNHRVVFLAYIQPAVFDFSSINVADRNNFDVVAFANETGLGLPVAATFINVPPPLA